MDENIRFMQLVDALKVEGVIPDYVRLAQELGTNKAGINDLKSGRKKLSIDLLRRMKLSYPQISIEWVIMGTGSMFEEAKEHRSESIIDDRNNILLSKVIEQAEEIGRLKEKVAILEEEKSKLLLLSPPRAVAETAK